MKPTDLENVFAVLFIMCFPFIPIIFLALAGWAMGRGSGRGSYIRPYTGNGNQQSVGGFTERIHYRHVGYQPKWRRKGGPY